MSIIDDIGLGGVGDWITGNSSWLKPVIGAGIGAVQQGQKDNLQSDYLNYLKQSEDQNFANSQAQIDFYNQQLAAKGAAAAAKRNAAIQTEANRQAAARKANQSLQKTYKQVLQMYQPYVDTATKLLPEKTASYEQALNLQNALGKFVNSPSQVARLNGGSTPAYMIDVPLGGK